MPTSVSAHAVSVPVQRPTRMATRQLDRRDYLIVEISADGDGEEVGIGYAYAGTRGGRLHAEIVDELLAPLVSDLPIEDIVHIWERMYQETLLAGRRGGVLRATSAVDIALWDLAAKRQGVPLGVLLGGSVRPVPAYASGGYYRPDDGPWPEAVAREIASNRELGFEDHKIKVGGLTVREDAARVEAAVGAIGAGGRVALDANNAYRTVPEALHAIRAFERAAEPVGLWWIEEPLSPDDNAGHAEIAARVQTPVATGEIHQTRWEFRDLIERRAAGILQPDAGVLGGVTEWMRVARAAETFGLPVAPHWHANLHAQLALATPACLAIEHFTLEKDVYNFERLVTPATRLAFGGGCVHPSERSGLGIELDRDALERYASPR